MGLTMNRIKIAALLIVLASCVVTNDKVADVETFKVGMSTGIVQGYLSDSAADVVAWDDIPFAQPPVGDLRWRATRPLTAANQIIRSKDDTACVQKASDYGGVSGEGIVGSEDCLYLDVKAPADFKDKNYPVMFWIHGGGNTTGLKDFYDYSRLVASRDVVVVSTNYRLGGLGWFSHPAIQDRQEGEDKSTNFGTLDIIEALKWVQTNIVKFGGNPDNVTIFGESAGGHNVYALLASPKSDGLFHKAISQSGYTTSHSLEDAHNRDGGNPLVERGSWQIVESINEFNVEQDDNENLAIQLRDMDAREFIGLYYQKESIDSIPLTTRDGIVIPKIGLLAALGDRKYAKNVPVMAGATKDEVSLWHGLHRYFMETDYRFTKILPPIISIKNPELFDLWVRTRSHAWKLRGVDIPLSAMESAGYDELFAYRFDWDHQKSSMFADFPSILGAAHGTDIAFVTGQYTYGPISSYIYPDGPARDQMEQTVMSAWSSFSSSATPDTGSLVQWNAFESDVPAFIHLDKNDLLRMDIETETMDSLLLAISDDPVPTDLEKCLIVWESLINVGDPDLGAFRNWNNGFCGRFDVRQEQKDIQEQLIGEFGSIGVGWR
jgi:para-nitrobenzyl esterase